MRYEEVDVTVSLDLEPIKGQSSTVGCQQGSGKNKVNEAFWLLSDRLVQTPAEEHSTSRSLYCNCDRLRLETAVR